MDPKRTALILIGFQNDYFSPDGILHGVIEDSSKITSVLANTFKVIERLKTTSILMISTPILFTPDYSELIEPVGILKTIKDVQAFKKGSKGSQPIAELLKFGERILEVPGKRGLNAFSNTKLDDLLKERKISNVVLAGAVTSVCIDSTGRDAFERGYKVFILSDCTAGRTSFEQEYFCNNVFPLYATVVDHMELLQQMEEEE